MEKMPGLPAIDLPTSLSSRDLAAILTEVPPKVPLPPDIKLPPGVPFPPLPPPIPPSKRERYDEIDSREPYDSRNQNKRWHQEPRGDVQSTNQIPPNQSRSVQDPRTQQQNSAPTVLVPQLPGGQHLPPFNEVDKQSSRHENFNPARQEFERPNVFESGDPQMRYNNNNNDDNNRILSWREKHHRQSLFDAPDFQNTGPPQPPHHFMDDRIHFRPEAPSRFQGPPREPPRPPSQQFYDHHNMPRGPRGTHGPSKFTGRPREPGHFDHRPPPFNRFQDPQRFPNDFHNASGMNQGPPRHFNNQKTRFPSADMSNEYRPRNQGGNIRFPQTGPGPQPRFGPRGGDHHTRPHFEHPGEMPRPPFNMNENNFQRPPIVHPSEHQQHHLPFTNSQQTAQQTAPPPIQSNNRSVPLPHSTANIASLNDQSINPSHEFPINNRARGPERRDRPRVDNNEPFSTHGNHHHRHSRYENQRKRRHDDSHENDGNDPWGRSRKWHNERRVSKPNDLEDGELPP